MKVKQVGLKFLKGERAKVGHVVSHGHMLTIHGNAIAERRNGGELWVTWAGWVTRMTARHLCNIGVDARIIDGEPYINGKEVSANEWVRVSDAGKNIPS